jgi:hypothetical protein
MANASLLSTKVGIPFLQKQFTVLEHKPSNDREFVTSKTPVRRSCHQLEPELRIAARMRHMNVWWLTIFKAVEEEPIAPDPEQCWHAISLPPSIRFQNLRPVSTSG